MLQSNSSNSSVMVHFILFFCRFVQTFVYHKIWTLRRLFYEVKLFIWIVFCINIFSSIYTFIPIWNTHTYSKVVWNIFKILNIWCLQCYLKNLQESMNWKMWNDLLYQHRILSQNSKCCIHCRNLSMPWSNM